MRFQAKISITTSKFGIIGSVGVIYPTDLFIVTATMLDDWQDLFIVTAMMLDCWQDLFVVTATMLDDWWDLFIVTSTMLVIGGIYSNFVGSI